MHNTTLKVKHESNNVLDMRKGQLFNIHFKALSTKRQHVLLEVRYQNLSAKAFLEPLKVDWGEVISAVALLALRNTQFKMYVPCMSKKVPKSKRCSQAWVASWQPDLESSPANLLALFWVLDECAQVQEYKGALSRAWLRWDAVKFMWY